MHLKDQPSFLQNIWYFEAFSVAESSFAATRVEFTSHGNHTAAETLADGHIAIFYSLCLFFRSADHSHLPQSPKLGGYPMSIENSF